jgi:hypothetical protein
LAWSNIQATLNTTGLPNVSYTLTTSDYPDALTQAQNMIKVQGGFWTNTSVGGVQNQFIPATSILFLTIS